MYQAKEEKIIKSQKGITLIALVITIIILLILAGVTLNTAIGENGLFKRAKLATEKYQEAEVNETASLAQFEKEIKNAYIDYNDYVGYEVTGYTPTGKQEGSEFKITAENSGIDNTVAGFTTSTDQEFTTENLGGWQIWGYNTSTKVVRLISAKPTEAKLTLKGAEGYNNGVWALNEICRQCYGTNEKGINVSNLKRSDIQKVTKYDYTEYEARIISLWKCKKI